MASKGLRRNVRPPKKLGKERAGFEKKGLEAKGVYGPREGLERPQRKVRPKTLERAIKNISAYTERIKGLSAPELKRELQKVQGKIAELKKKISKAKKSKKAVYEKELSPLLMTEKLIIELYNKKFAEIERRNLEFRNKLKDFKKEYSQTFREENLRVPKKNIRKLNSLLNRIDTLIRTRGKEIPQDVVKELQDLRNKVEARVKELTTKAGRIKAEKARARARRRETEERARRTLPAVRGLEYFPFERELAQEPLEELFARFYKGIKEPEKNATALERLSSIITDVAERDYTALAENKRMPNDQKRQALLSLRTQIDEFLSNTTRRLQLMNRPGMLKVKYIENLYNSLQKYLAKIDLDIKGLTPPQSIEGRRVAIVEGYRARSPREPIPPVSPPPSPPTLPPPSPEARAEQAAREAEAERERAKKVGKDLRMEKEITDMVRRIERVRNEVRANREVLAKMIDLQKQLMNLTRSKGADLEKGIAEIKNSLDGLTKSVRVLDENLSRALINNILVISGQMNDFLERFSAGLEREHRFTNEQLTEIKILSIQIRDMVNAGIQDLNRFSLEMDALSHQIVMLDAASRERYEKLDAASRGRYELLYTALREKSEAVMGQADIIKEDIKSAKEDLEESLSTVASAVFGIEKEVEEINKNVRNLNENTTKVLKRLSALDGTFLSIEHFDKTLLKYMEEIREGAGIGVDVVLDKIKEESQKLLKEIKESDPAFAKKLMEKLEYLEGLTVEQGESILKTLNGLHEDTTAKLEEIKTAISKSKKEVLDILSKIAKGTETDIEIKKIVEELKKNLKDTRLDNEKVISALEAIAERLESIEGRLDANNTTIADILRRIIQEELSERLNRMEEKLDTLVAEGAKKSDTDAIQAKIDELKDLISRLSQPGVGVPPGVMPPGEIPPGRRPLGEPEVEYGGKRPGEERGTEGETKVPKPEERKPSAFSKAAGWGFGLGIPIALIALLVFVLAKIFGGGTSSTVSTVKTATVPVMPVTGTTASTGGFLPPGFMTPLIIILILVALFLLFPKGNK